jgi:hypothetical protein
LRYAIVAELGSGLRATFGKRGHVDWADEQKSKAFMNMRQEPTDDPAGYRIPDYGMYGPRSLLKHIDPVVALRMVPESEWSASQHHTVPYPIEP